MERTAQQFLAEHCRALLTVAIAVLFAVGARRLLADPVAIVFVTREPHTGAPWTT